MSNPSAPNARPSAIHVPPGRTLADVPKSAPIPPPSGAAKPPNTQMTLRKFLVGELDEKAYLVQLLQDLGTSKKKGPWREYFEFFRANQSGDFESFRDPDKRKIEKMKKDLEDAYFEQQDL